MDPFFDMSVTAGNYAPRRRTTANVSKRLMAVIKQFREAEAAIRGERVEGWGEMMTGLDEEDPKGRGTGKRREKGKKRGVDEASLEVMPKEDDDDGFKQEEAVKKPKRSRKNTASSIAPTDVSTSSDLGGLEGEDEDVNGKVKVVRGKGKGRGRARGRGTRKWQGERWDVIQRPD